MEMNCVPFSTSHVPFPGVPLFVVETNVPSGSIHHDRKIVRNNAKVSIVVALVAVMRRLATIIWKMVKYNEPYCPGGPSQVAKQRVIVSTLA